MCYCIEKLKLFNKTGKPKTGYRVSEKIGIMFSNVGLDIFIGLIFIFLLYSLLTSIIQEIIANKLAFRSKVLEMGILRMLEDGKSTSQFQALDRIKGFFHMFGKPNLLKNKTIAPWFYAHPLIQYLGEDNFYSKPSYITAQNFSKVIIDLLKGFGVNGTNETQTISDSISNGTIYKLPISIDPDRKNPAIKALILQESNTLINALDTVKINPDTALFLKSIWAESGADPEKFKLKLELWFNDTMDRASGWYKRYTQYILLILGFIIAVAFNVDTTAIYKIISKDKTAREQLVQMAINDKDKYAGIITDMKNNQNTSAASVDSVIKTKDSVLNKTYQMVADDADAANQILGLGRPWVDTCNMWKDSVDQGFVFRLDSLNTLVKNINSAKLIIRERNDSLKNIIKDKDSKKVLTLKKGLDSLCKISIDSLSNLYNENEVSKTLMRMAFFKNRYEFIETQMAKSYFKYSPRQAGGWETFFGWLLTALAISLGAPFWFDMLNKIMKLRGSGVKLDSSDNASNTNVSSPTTAPGTVSVNLNNQTSEEAVG